MNWTRAVFASPPVDQQVLGVVQDAKGHRNVRIVIYNGQQWLFATSGNAVDAYGHSVTHWMPLPDLPTHAQE